MLLASSPAPRPLPCALHMAESSSQSEVILPLSGESLGDKEHADTTTPLLRPRTGIDGTGNPSHAKDGFFGTESLKSNAESLSLSASDYEPSCDLKRDEGVCSFKTPPSTAGSTTTSTSTVAASVVVSAHDNSDLEIAVREDCEGFGQKDEERFNDESHRQSPSPSSSLSSRNLRMRTQQLVSVLKTSAALKAVPGDATRKGRSTRTRRRIRGLWGDDSSCQFSQLHDETIQSIMTFLSMRDMCVASMVCQRWKHLALSPDSWKRIDATDFVKQAYDHYSKNDMPKKSATKSTSLALAARIERWSPHSLSIHSIKRRLSADNFLSSLPSLQELTLTSFTELTDTHIHVLLLSSSCKNVQARSKRSCIMRKLVLEHCPLLTDATVQSIGKLCPELEEISLKGNSLIKDLSPLSDLWTLAKKRFKPPRAAAPAPSTTAKGSSSLSMLFGPPPSSTSGGSTTAPALSPRRPSTPTNSLQSLFALPGHSPPRTSNVTSILPRPLSKGSAKPQGKLKCIDVSGTGVTASSLVKAWKAIPPGHMVRLEKVIMHGNGASWNDTLLGEMAETLDLTKLRSLDIACSVGVPPNNFVVQPSRVTDQALRALVKKDGEDDKPLRSLMSINLQGHSLLTGAGIADLILAAESTMEEVVLNGCKGISARTKNPASDFAKIDALGKAIFKCATTTTSRRDVINATGGRKGLRYLSLFGCFSSEKELNAHRDTSLQQMHEETMGTFLLESLGPKQIKNKTNASTPLLRNPSGSSFAIATLRELDLSNCWFVTSKDIAALQKRCPNLYTIHLQGTRASSNTYGLEN